MKDIDPKTSQVNSIEKSRTEHEQWLHMYRQMLKIRKFEENVNQLYTTAKMPGLSHLSTGQEAVAVGVCESLRSDDYITSTHRGHGHCLAKGAKTNLMFAEWHLLFSTHKQDLNCSSCRKAVVKFWETIVDEWIETEQTPKKKNASKKRKTK
jgi:TPP-dependent pyruvate/acetoin dehydrogenase alpha subunit